MKKRKPRPVAWLHTMHFERGCGSDKALTFTKAHPWGKPRIDYSAEYRITSEPLYRLAVGKSVEDSK